MRFRLRDNERDVELTRGMFVVGRGDECQLSLDDKLVSRRHARFVVADDSVWVEDLGSRNGVQVNGVTVKERTELAHGDVIAIGDTALTLVRVEEGARRRLANADETLSQYKASTSVVVVSGLIEKALALGKIQEAQRLMTNVVRDAQAMLTAGIADSALLPDVAARAIHVASESGDVSWVEAVFRLYEQSNEVIPTPIVDELHALAHRHRFPASAPLRNYVAALQSRASSLGPSDRFAVRRLEGLVRVLQS